MIQKALWQERLFEKSESPQYGSFGRLSSATLSRNDKDRSLYPFGAQRSDEINTSHSGHMEVADDAFTFPQRRRIEETLHR